MENKQEKQKSKLTKKQKIWIAVVVVVVILAAIAGNSDDGATDQTAETTPSVNLPSTGEAEPNSTAKVDALAREAKAVVAEGFTDEQRDEAVAFIVKNFPNYYGGNEMMEQAITYGYLLEYAYKNDAGARDYAELGADVVQAVKYVYRGVETVLDDATRKNLLQVRDTLAKLGYSVDWKE